MSTNNPLYEQYFPQGGFHILDPLNPNTFSERSCPDREYDFTPTYPEIQPDGSIIRAVIPGFERGYGLDSSGPPNEWYSARGDRAENQSEADTPFYHLHLFDSPAQTMETLGDTHRNEMSKDPTHWASRDYNDSANPEDWGEMLGRNKRVRMALFVALCQWVQGRKDLGSLNKGYWKFRHKVDEMFKDNCTPCFRWLTSSQVRVVFNLFRARRENLRAGR